MNLPFEPLFSPGLESLVVVVIFVSQFPEDHEEIAQDYYNIRTKTKIHVYSMPKLICAHTHHYYKWLSTMQAKGKI